MYPNKRLSSVFALTAAAAMVLAACGAPAAPAAPTAAPAPAATEAPKPTEAPAATEAPKATEAPAATEAPKATEAPAAMASDKMIAAADCTYGGSMKSIEAVDDMTVKFTLCAPDPAFPFKIAGDPFPIFDADYLKETGGDSVKISESAVGTGPYKLKEWKRGESMTLEANADYWGEKAKTPTFVLRWSKEGAQRLLELQSGNADGISNVAPDDFATVSGDSSLKLTAIPPVNTMYIGLNNIVAPFDNEKVRQAFAYGIDRKRIVDDYYPAGSTVATSFVPDSFAFGVSPDVGWYEYDPEKAKALLKEAGKENLEVTISYRDVVRGYLPTPGKVAQEIQAQLKEIGVTVKIEVKESGAFLDGVTAGTEPFYLLGWGADYPDATNFLDYHFGPQQIQYGKPYEDIAAALKDGATTSDPAKRKAAYDKINTLLKQYVPMIPVAHGASALAYRADVEGSHANPVSANIFAAMKGSKDTLVYVQNAEPISLYCPDESDGETFTACAQLFEGLLAFKIGTSEVQGALAESFTGNADATEWTFKLRPGVKFHNGSTLDSGDVLTSLGAMWDAKHPLHKGRTGTFEYWTAYFGPLLNAPKP